MELSMASAASKPDIKAAGDTASAQRDQERGQRFAELLQAEPLRANFYVDPPASGLNGSNPVAAFVSRFDSVDFASEALRRGEALTAATPESAYAMTAREAVHAQAEILRTVIMMETVNTAKQGVSTIFQQQG